MRLHTGEKSTGEKSNRLLLTALRLHVMIKQILKDEDAE